MSSPYSIPSLSDDLLRLYNLGILPKLLNDNNTGQSIIWATDIYAELGKGFCKQDAITIHALLAYGQKLQYLRKVKKSQRTRQHGEVFTPLSICAKMCGHAHDILYQNNWQEYVNTKVLEITCGEAPFLVSRKNQIDNEFVSLPNRCGLLDHKLQVINANVHAPDTWLAWVYKAFQASYGYELQGDNLLLARINLLKTFEDYLAHTWQRSPQSEEYAQICHIIVCNIWQMDGLTHTVPFAKLPETNQGSLFDYGRCDNALHCQVQNWQTGKAVDFNNINIGKCAMKFDFVIGNPPYQEEAPGTSTSDLPVYNIFMDEVYKVATCVELITPARFLFNAGATPDEWNKKMLADEHLKVLHYEPDTSKIFPNIQIPGGIVITYRDSDNIIGPIGQFTAFIELYNINQKVLQLSEKSLNTIMYSQCKFNLSILYNDFPEMQDQIGNDGKDKRFRQIVMERFPFLFSENIMQNCIKVLGLINKKRAYRYINEKYVENEEWLTKYKVFVPFSNGASGTLGTLPARMISKPVLGAPGEGMTQTFIGVGQFDTKEEAENLLKYINSKFARVLLGILKVTQGNKPETWQYVPLQDFTANSDINWTKSIAEIDQQLYKKYGLDEQEIEFIETHVKEMA